LARGYESAMTRGGPLQTEATVAAASDVSNVSLYAIRNAPKDFVLFLILTRQENATESSILYL